jgi:sulfide:quinone oxidoreductase
MNSATSTPLHIVIAGGGVAGVEALLALHDLAGDRVALTLVAPDPDFTYRPLAVAEPFGVGHAERIALRRFTDEVGAVFVRDAVEAVDDASGEARLRSGGTIAFDALLLATGGRQVAGIEGATTWWPGGDPDVYGGLLRDIDEGYTKSVAIVVPPGAVWPLPAYELALMTMGEARAMGHDDVELTVVTPEHAPLSLFGTQASEAVAEELRLAGVGLHTGVVAGVRPGGLDVGPHLGAMSVQRIVAIPRLLGPDMPGVESDQSGFVQTGEDGRVAHADRVWAAGDGIVSPVKFGALATHQARCAAAGIARFAGATDVPNPGEPVLHGHLLVGQRARRLAPAGRQEGAPLWWPAGKLAGEHLPRWLAEHGLAARAVHAAPPRGALPVRRSLSSMAGPEAQYLYDLARQFRTDDPAIARLGRRTHERHDALTSR